MALQVEPSQTAMLLAGELEATAHDQIPPVFGEDGCPGMEATAVVRRSEPVARCGRAPSVLLEDGNPVGGGVADLAEAPAGDEAMPVGRDA
jgi:hypothetical protein